MIHHLISVLVNHVALYAEDINTSTSVHDKNRRTPHAIRWVMNMSLREQNQMRQLVGIEDIENNFSDAWLC